MNNEISIKLDKVLAALIELRENNKGRSQLKTIGKKELLDTSDMIILFQVEPKTLYRWRKKCLLKFVKISGKCFYLWNDVLSILESRFQ
jgi:hypothetical protein